MNALLGHESAWREWRAAMASTRMHHGWILAGPQGLGKAHFARAAAAELLAEPGVPQPAPEAHPDILTLERLPENDDEAKKREDGQDYRTKRNIAIEQIRTMQHRLITRPTLGARRVVIIDPADALEKGSVNALLKSLEEPPVGTFFLLISHQPGRLLPTVRSRCRMLRFAPLADGQVEAVMRDQAPQASLAERAAALQVARGSPGQALAFVAQELGEAWDIMRRIIEQGDPVHALRGALSQDLGSGKAGRERLLAALDLALAGLAAHLRNAPPASQRRMIEAHAALVELAAKAPTHNFEPALAGLEIGALLARAAG